MANQEQLSILKRGVEAWNGWRAKNIYVYADLKEADLNGVHLSQADLRIAHLRRANLFRADLSGADLSGADLSDANLREANLSEADLTNANLNGARLGSTFAKDVRLRQANLLAADLKSANFSRANFSEANLMLANLEGADLAGANLSHANLTKADLAGIRLRRADLSGARLTKANLTSANLVEAKFIDTDLTGTNFSHASVGISVFVNSDLSQVIGLESLDHRGPSHISINTFVLSKAKIPEVFLRGCGLSDADTEYVKLSNPDLSQEQIKKILYKIQELRAAQSLQISPLFIVYSRADRSFVDKVGSSLTKQGIRFWHEMHDENVRRTEKQIDRALCQNATVLLVLSESALSSDWLEPEIRATERLEKEMGRKVLYPLVLDNSWTESRGQKQVVEQIMEYHILDFSGWRNDRQFEGLVHNLIDGLELFYTG